MVKCNKKCWVSFFNCGTSCCQIYI